MTNFVHHVKYCVPYKLKISWRILRKFVACKMWILESLLCYSVETELPESKTIQKNLHDPDNHDGVITYLELDILECEVKWALESITTNKVMEFQLSYFKSWKMMLWKCCTQYASKFGKLSSGHRTGKGQFSFQSQRKAMPKNTQTTAQLHSSHMLVK